MEKEKSIEYAIAWSENQGNYSENIAKKILNFIKNQGLVVNSVLDICCGSANFLNEMAESGKICSGTEFMESYIEYDKKKYPNMTFIKTETVDDIELLPSYDLISCNHDVVNYLPNLNRWGQFFKKVYNHLNDGGLFVFDYYTKRRLANWNEVTVSGNERTDYIKKVESDGETQTTITDVFYTNLNPEVTNSPESQQTYNKFKKTEDKKIEFFFENEDIMNEIKKAGYRYLITTDANFSPVSGISDMNRMHIIAIKREH